MRKETYYIIEQRDRSDNALTDRWHYKTDREKWKREVHTINRQRTHGHNWTIGYRVIGCHGRDSDKLDQVRQTTYSVESDCQFPAG